MLAAAFSLHNAEEIWFDLPAWISQHLFDLGEVELRVYLVAVLLLTTIAWTIVIAAWRDGISKVTMAIVVLLSSALVANGISHAALSLATGTLMPGVLTAVGLLVPSAIYCFVVLGQRMQLSWRAGAAFLLAGGVIQMIVPPALILAIDIWI